MRVHQGPPGQGVGRIGTVRYASGCCSVAVRVQCAQRGAGVLGGHEGVAFGELPDLFGPEDEHVVAGGCVRRACRGAVLSRSETSPCDLSPDAPTVISGGSSRRF